MSEKTERFDIEKFPKKIMNSLDSPVIVVDVDGNIVWVNQKWQDITKLSNGAILGKNISDVLRDGDCHHCPGNVTFKLHEITTDYGKVLIARRTDGFEIACNTFNGIAQKNKVVLERMVKTWSEKGNNIVGMT